MEQPKLLFEGKYEILAKIREGGMGTIYRVRHRLLDEVRVVKVMRPHVVADEDLKRRFLEEAKTAIRLKHPNLCAIHDFAADEGGTAYLVMEYIDGANLADLLKARGPLGARLTIEIGHQALLALGYLHRKGVIHRDVAPDNLMLTHDEEGRPVVKLIDLGIAKAVNRMDMTGTGVFLGKLKYASPEQFGSLPAGEKIDGRSDLYGLGVVLYEVLTGIRPHKGVSPAELLRAHLVEAPIPFSESDKEGRVPPELRTLIFRALEKKRDQRFASAEDFDRELSKLKGRFDTPGDLESTASIMSTVRSTKPSASDGVTPSAQDRLDLHFGVQATPSPTAPPLKIVPLTLETLGAPTVAVPPEDMETVSAPAIPAPGAPEGKTHLRGAAPPPGPQPGRTPAAAPPAGAATAPSPRKSPPPGPTAAPKVEKATAPVPAPVAPSAPSFVPPTRPRPRVALLAIGAAIALAALLLWHPWAARRPSEEIAVVPSPAAEPAAEPTAPPAPSPAPTAAPTHAPTAQPTSAPTAAPTPRPATTAAPRAPAAAEAARVAAAAARRDADLARAQELAPEAYQRALERYNAGASQAARGRDDQAKKAFDVASALFGQAVVAARAQARIPATAPPPPVRIAEAPTALPRPTAVPLLPTAAPPVEAVAPAPAPAERKVPAPPAAAASAATAEAREQITKVVGDYAWAQTTQDERLFAQVFPGGIENFKLTFKNLKTQNVRLDIRSISVEGSRATVSAHEVVVAKPRAGDEVRNEATVTLQLEKDADRWIIVSRR